ncbi:MAG: pyridoxine 5'-phosphate synthase [Leptolyngbyaceae cyanobacterium CRU_2_3]|nr:pyridoxine 5'-phosphate synthase [Leptolyngbyaceae cyanobacterium CRU_2_3]
MTHLSVNLNRVALLRNSRNIGIPSVIDAARTVLNAGAYGVTVHPRPDQRHIKPADVYELAELLQAEYPTAEYNIEGNPFEAQFMELVSAIKPSQCTLVPDSPDAFTSDHGWDLPKDSDRLTPIIQQLQDSGIRVSLFMDAIGEPMPQAKAIGANRVELYTEPYATAFRQGQVDPVFSQYAIAAQAAQAAGLGVNAGHDLNLSNLAKFCTIPGILEVSIGHALMAEALEMGLFNTVKTYLNILR